MEQCSDLFAKVFDSHGSGCYRRCACGREHFDISDNGWSWAEGELEGLKAKAKENPDIYIEHDGAVGCLSISGIDVVYGCTCPLAAKNERFILDNEEQIAAYLRLRAAELRARAAAIDLPIGG